MPDRFFSFLPARRKKLDYPFEEVIIIEPVKKMDATAELANEAAMAATAEPIAEVPMVPPPVQITETPAMDPLHVTYLPGPIIQPEHHTLLLLFAEDFYKGHAKVQITLEDRPVFTQPHPVTARRDRMQQEIITLRGEWPTPLGSASRSPMICGMAPMTPIAICSFMVVRMMESK